LKVDDNNTSMSWSSNQTNISDLRNIDII